MARVRKVAYKGARPRPVIFQSQETPGKDFMQFVVDRPQVAFEVEAFKEYFLEQVVNQVIGLTASGVTVARRALLGAETEWGQARMRGSYYGVPFRPYGKGPGRYDTGNMFDALKLLKDDSAYTQFKFSFGYDMSMDRSQPTGGERATIGRPYFMAQERGFISRRAFSPSRTQATGRASFDEAKRPKKVKGAMALPAGAESIRKRIDSRFAFAWNRAVKIFEANGFNPANVGSYIDARDAYRRNPPPRASYSQSRPAASGPIASGGSYSGLFPGVDMSEYGITDARIRGIQNRFKGR